jgi:predicted RNase H-like nuclease
VSRSPGANTDASKVLARKRVQSGGVDVVGVDGCPGGWIAVSQTSGEALVARVYRDFSELLRTFPKDACIGIDIPIGLVEQGARCCEVEARQFLGRPRQTSIFPAPLRACLAAMTYQEACQIRFEIEGKKMSRQAYGILNKIREVDHVLAADPNLETRVIEVHPELSFALMNSEAAMRHRKKSSAGKDERRSLLESSWEGAIDQLRPQLRGEDYALDDLHDAVAALWSARRWALGRARIFGDPTARDRRRLPMRMAA